jgi:hypothetical protein
LEKEGRRSEKQMYSEKELKDILRRSNFYKKQEVAKFLLTHGVPRNKGAMLKLLSFDDDEEGPRDATESSDCLRGVTFAVHPQQINIWDKSNGRMIISIPR